MTLDPVWFAAGLLSGPVIAVALFFAIIGLQRLLRDRA
jgi:hypothetical protein